MAGTNNFTIHNPSNANQEPDSSFAADALTTGGIGTDAIMPSAWMNARWYEDSMGFYCLAQALANKGYNLSKDNVANLTAVLSNIVTNADTKPPLMTVAYSPTPTFDASLANGFDITLNGNVTSSTLINAQIGQILTFIITQNGVGGLTFAYPSNVGGAFPIYTGPGGISIQQFIVKENGTIFAIESFVGILSQEVTTLNGQVSTLNSEVGTINGQISTIDGQISTLNSEVGTINGNISTIDGQITNLNSEVGTLQGQITPLTTAASQGSILISNGSSYVQRALAIHDNTGSRSFGTTYTNSTGAEMYVSGYGNTTGGHVASVQCLVNGVAVFANTVGATVDNGACGFSFIVPSGATYSILANTLSGGSSGVNGLDKWIETYWS